MLERKKAFVSGTVKQIPIEPKFPTDNKFNSGPKKKNNFFFYLKVLKNEHKKADAGERELKFERTE